MNLEVQICYDSLTSTKEMHFPRMKVALCKNGSGSMHLISPRFYERQNKRRGVLILQIMTFVIDITLEWETDCSMGFSIDAIREFEQ